MTWEIRYLDEAEKDFKKLEGNEKQRVTKALQQVKKNPLSPQEGGYGKPLGNKHGIDLSGLSKVKIKSVGVRVVYKVIETDEAMIVIVIGARADDKVYKTAEKRRKKYGL